VIFKGNNVHPGTAKNKMVNAGKMAAQFIQNMPEKEAPEYTEGYEGFFHLLSVEGDVEKTEAYYIIRDHDREKFEKRKEKMKAYVNAMQEQYGETNVEL